MNSPRITFRAPTPLFEAVRAQAKQDKQTPSEYIRKVLEQNRAIQRRMETKDAK